MYFCLKNKGVQRSTAPGTGVPRTPTPDRALTLFGPLDSSLINQMSMKKT